MTFCDVQFSQGVVGNHKLSYKLAFVPFKNTFTERLKFVNMDIERELAPKAVFRILLY